MSSQAGELAVFAPPKWQWMSPITLVLFLRPRAPVLPLPLADKIPGSGVQEGRVQDLGQRSQRRSPHLSGEGMI